MKKFRFLLLAMLLVFSMALFTGCGVEEPTLEDVEEALRDEGYLPEDDDADKDSDDEDGGSDNEDTDKKDNKTEWEVTIDKCKLNDDKDKATVTATLKVTNGSVETSTEFKITFKIKDDKSWKCKEVEKGESESKLVSGISDEEAEKIAKTCSYNIEEGDIDAYVYGDSLSSLTVGEHENDLENMKDVVKFTATGVDGFIEVEFEAEVTFYYSVSGEYWYASDVKVLSGAKVDFVDSYKFSADAKDVQAALEEEDDYCYFLGSYYYYNECELTDFEIEDVEPNGSSYYLEVPCSFTMTNGDVSMKITATVEYYYDGSGWEYEYIYDETLESWESDIIGTWKGVDEGEGNVTIEIPADFDEDGYLFATVTVASTDNGTYSYTMKVYGYDPVTGEIDLSFGEWITMPKDGNTYGYTNYGGEISKNDGVWRSTYSWDNYSFSKDSAGTTTPEPTTAPEEEATPAPTEEAAE